MENGFTHQNAKKYPKMKIKKVSEERKRLQKKKKVTKNAGMWLYLKNRIVITGDRNCVTLTA